MSKKQFQNGNNTNNLVFQNEVVFSIPGTRDDAVNVEFEKFSLYEDSQYTSYVTCSLDDIEI